LAGIQRPRNNAHHSSQGAGTLDRFRDLAASLSEKFLSALAVFAPLLLVPRVVALLIALVGCLEGLKVRGSAESVGHHTTSSAVQGIFLVILFDALFAIFLGKLGL